MKMISAAGGPTTSHPCPPFDDISVTSFEATVALHFNVYSFVCTHFALKTAPDAPVGVDLKPWRLFNRCRPNDDGCTGVTE